MTKSKLEEERALFGLYFHIGSPLGEDLKPGIELRPSGLQAKHFFLGALSDLLPAYI